MGFVGFVFGFICGVAFVFLAAAFAMTSENSTAERKRENKKSEFDIDL